MGCSTYWFQWWTDAAKVQKFTETASKMNTTTAEAQQTVTYFTKQFDDKIKDVTAKLRIVQPALNAQARIYNTLKKCGKENSVEAVNAKMHGDRLMREYNMYKKQHSFLTKSLDKVYHKTAIIAQTELDQLDVQANAAILNHMLQHEKDNAKLEKMKERMLKIDEEMTIKEHSSALQETVENRMKEDLLASSNGDSFDSFVEQAMLEDEDQQQQRQVAIDVHPEAASVRNIQQVLLNFNDDVQYNAPAIRYPQQQVQPPSHSNAIEVSEDVA